MTRSNIEILLEAEAAARRDPAAFVEYCDPEVVWDPGPTMPEGRAYRGHAGLAEFWQRWVSAWSDYEYENRRRVEIGDMVVQEAHQHAIGRGSGVEVTWDFGSLFTFREGLIVRYESFRTYDEALAEARRRAGEKTA